MHHARGSTNAVDKQHRHERNSKKLAVHFRQVLLSLFPPQFQANPKTLQWVSPISLSPRKSLLLSTYSFPLSRILRIALFGRDVLIAKPTVKYADHVTTSPDPAVDVPQLQHPAPHPTIDNDPDNEGGHRSPSHPVPPKSFSEPSTKPGRRTSSQSFRRRTTWGGLNTSVANSNTTQDRDAPSTTILQRARTNFSNLFVPEHKVGKAPGVMRELRTILFGSCASWCLICLWVSEVLMPATRVQHSLVDHPGLCACFVASPMLPQHELIDVSYFFGSQWALHFAKPHEYTLVFVCA